MRQMRTQDGYTVKELCATFDVSRSGFYAQGQKAQRGRRQQDARLAEQIGVLFMQSRQTYGCRRLQHQLRREGIRCGKSRIRRLMNQGQLQAIQKRRFRVKTTQSHHDLPVAPNRLGQLAQPPSRPNQVWTAEPHLPAHATRRLAVLGGRNGPVFQADRRHRNWTIRWPRRWWWMPSDAPCAPGQRPPSFTIRTGVFSMQLPASGKCFKPIRLNPV
jgi:helix-turn-helix protein